MFVFFFVVVRAVVEYFFFRIFFLFRSSLVFFWPLLLFFFFVSLFRFDEQFVVAVAATPKLGRHCVSVSVMNSVVAITPIAFWNVVKKNGETSQFRCGKKTADEWRDSMRSIYFVRNVSRGRLLLFFYCVFTGPVKQENVGEPCTIRCDSK